MANDVSFLFRSLTFNKRWNFLEAYCWARTGERQASRMRVTYLKAVLRQDVGYFDLDISTTSEVITTISNDSLMIQDAISEKVCK